MSEVIISQHAYYESTRGGVDGFISRPVAEGRWPAVVIGHEWWGLVDWSRQFTRQLAEHGFVAFTPDLYHGVTTTEPATAARLKAELDIGRAVRDTVEAASYLRGLPYVSEKVGVMGFCMGGGIALLAACRSTAFQAAVIFHHSIYPDPREVEQLNCPLQGHFGLADVVTPLVEAKMFENQLIQFSKPHEVHYYEGADHCWLNTGRPDVYRAEAAQLALQRTVEFFQSHLK